MNNGSYFIPREQIYPFSNPSSMNNMEGLYVFWETDPVIARRVLPPQLELTNPEHPIVMVYVVNIREPTFAPWYMEGGLMLLGCRYDETVGSYFLNLQLSGPGASMALVTGRECGLPKKICDRIVVERTEDYARAFIESKGRRIFAVDVELGTYNEPTAAEFFKDVVPGYRLKSSSLLFQYETQADLDGRIRFTKMKLVNYDSIMVYQAWEPGSIKSIHMDPSLDDPWAELTVVKPLGVGYSIASNPVERVSCLAEFEGEEADELISYLFSGRFDRSTICAGHQRYGQI